MQQGWQADDIVSVLKLLGWDAVFVRAALRDDVVILTSIPRRAEPLGYQF